MEGTLLSTTNHSEVFARGTSSATRPRSARRVSVVLWIIQSLLAALFLFAGVMKFVVPVETLTAQTSLSVAFLRFIGVAEVLGALGLVLPGLLRMLPVLTSLAAAGLAIIMVGATAITFSSGDAGAALMPFVTGVLCLFVAYGRWRIGR